MRKTAKRVAADDKMKRKGITEGLSKYFQRIFDFVTKSPVITTVLTPIKF